MSGDIDKILSELSKMQIPQFFGAQAQTKFAETVITSDSMRYQIGSPPINQAFPEGPVLTSEKMKFKSRSIDQPFISDSVRIKSASGDTVLLTDLLKRESEKTPDPGAGTSETVRYRIGIGDSASTSDVLKSIKVILTDSVLTSDKLKGANAFSDFVATSELVRFLLKSPESVTSSDLMKQGISFKQVYADTVITSDLLKTIKEVLKDSATVTDQERHKWTLTDNLTTSDLLKFTSKSSESLTTSDVLKKITARFPETPNVNDIAKMVLPLKNPDSAGTSESMKITSYLGPAELETTTDAQSSYIITNSLLNGSFDLTLTSWTISSSAGGSVAQVSSPAKFGLGACKTDGTPAITATAYITQSFTNITTGLVYLNWWMNIASYGVVGFNGGPSINIRDNASSVWCFTIHPASDGVYIGNVGANTNTFIAMPGVSPLATGIWHHFNVLYDITNKILKVYLNGLSVYSLQNLTTQNVGTVVFGDPATNVDAGLIYWDEACIGTVTTQGTSLITGAAPSPQGFPYSFDTQTGYDSPSSSNNTSQGGGGGNPFVKFT